LLSFSILQISFEQSSFQLVAICIVQSILVLQVQSVKKNKNQPKIFPFMPHRNKDNSGKFLPNTPAASHSHPSLFFSGNDQEEPLGEQPKIFKEPIGEE